LQPAIQPNPSRGEEPSMVRTKLFKDGRALLKLPSPQLLSSKSGRPSDGLKGNDTTEYTAATS